MISTSRPGQRQLTADQLEIRRMRSQDIAEVMEIESVSFGRHHWSDDSFHNELQNHVGRYYSLVLKPEAESQHLIGYLGIWQIGDEAHVTTVAVRSEYRGNSLGELLISHALDRAMGQTIHWLTLEVRVSNYSAQNLYYKYGFSSMGIRPKYYQDNQEDALIMTTPDILTDAYRDHYRPLKAALTEKLDGLPAGFGA